MDRGTKRSILVRDGLVAGFNAPDMALPSPETQTAEAGIAEYLSWQPPGAPVSVKIRLDVIEAMSAEVIEGFSALRRRGVEVGGLLIGRRENAIVFIDRYERVPCEYRFGPSYILSNQDKANFQETWARLHNNGNLSIVGFYRSHTRKDLRLEQSDLEIVHRWFNDEASIFLIVKPLDIAHLTAEFFFWENGALPMQSAGREFAFRATGAGGVAELKPQVLAPPPAAPQPAPSPILRDGDVQSKELPPPPIPQFLRSKTGPPPERSFLGRYWEALTALLLVLCAAGLFWWQHSSDNDSDSAEPPAVATRAAPSAPSPSPAPVTGDVPAPVSLGLEVRPAPGEWRVTWKRDLPVIQNARRGVLAIDDGAPRKQIGLDRGQLRVGNLRYRPSSDDVSFRLEVFDQDNQSAHESFRVLLAAKPGNTPAAGTAAPPAPVQKGLDKPASTAASQPLSGTSAVPGGLRQIPDLPKPSSPQPQAPPPERAKAPHRFVPAEVASRERPEVTEGIRSRITEDIVVLVKVTIDVNGRVVRAAPVTRGDGLTSYLARRATEAALKWRFEPARDNDQPVSSSQVIRFVFEK